MLARKQQTDRTRTLACVADALTYVESSAAFGLARTQSGQLTGSFGTPIFAERRFCRPSVSGKKPFIATINLNLSHVFFCELHRDVMFRFTETGIISAKI